MKKVKNGNTVAIKHHNVERSRGHPVVSFLAQGKLGEGSMVVNWHHL